jgi:hypothetical protein
MEKTLDKYCTEIMHLHGGTYEILPDIKVVAIYKADIQELEVLSFEDALENALELAL